MSDNCMERCIGKTDTKACVNNYKERSELYGKGK